MEKTSKKKNLFYFRYRSLRCSLEALDFRLSEHSIHGRISDTFFDFGESCFSRPTKKMELPVSRIDKQLYPIKNGLRFKSWAALDDYATSYEVNNSFNPKAFVDKTLVILKVYIKRRDVYRKVSIR